MDFSTRPETAWGCTWPFRGPCRKDPPSAGEGEAPPPTAPTCGACSGGAGKAPASHLRFGAVGAGRPPAERRRCEEAAVSGAPFPFFCRRRQHLLFSLAALGLLLPLLLPPPLLPLHHLVLLLAQQAEGSTALSFVRFCCVSSGRAPLSRRRQHGPGVTVRRRGERATGQRLPWSGGRGGS